MAKFKENTNFYLVKKFGRFKFHIFYFLKNRHNCRFLRLCTIFTSDERSKLTLIKSNVCELKEKWSENLYDRQKVIDDFLFLRKFARRREKI